jgi:hypothetical protein
LTLNIDTQESSDQSTHISTSSGDKIYHSHNIDGSKGILKGQSQDEGIATPIKSEGFPNRIIQLRGFWWEK